MRLLLLLTLLALLSPAYLTSRRGREKVSGRKLLVVSFDGFRWDFQHMPNASWFRWITEQGATTTDGSYIPAFATLTFPNHFTMVTGLHEESHGVIGNTMYDPDAPRSIFSLRNKTALRDSAWYRGEPLWITAEKAGKRAGTFFWPGSEAKYGGIRPKFWKIFDSTIDFRTRVDSVVQWMAREEVSVAMLYFEQPDLVSHRFGVFTKKMNETVSQLNDVLGYLIGRLKNEGLLPGINLVVTSDHGLARCNASAVVPLYSFLEQRRELMWIIVGEGALFGMKARPGRAEDLFRFMQTLQVRAELRGKFRVFRRADVPLRLHFRNNRRIPDVVVLASEGVFLKPRRPRRSIPYPGNFGCHGFDNALRTMRPFFAARGPHVRAGARVPPFQQVDLYNLLARLAGLPSRPNNGSWENVAKLYRAGPVFGNVYGVVGGPNAGLAREPLVTGVLLTVCLAAAALF